MIVCCYEKCVTSLENILGWQLIIEMKSLFGSKHKIWEDRELSLELRLVARIMITGELAAFAGMLITLAAHTHYMATVLTVILLIGIPSLYMICVPRKMYKAMRYTISFGVLVVMPLLWVYGGGLYSGMSIWIVFEVLFFSASLEGRDEIVANTLAVLLFVGALICWNLGVAKYELPTENDKYISIFGSTIAVVGMAIYITNFLKRLYRDEFETVELQNNSLKEYADKIEKANDYQKIFLANMSHEIRSPMNVVLGFNRLALGCFDVDEIHKYLRTIDNAGEALLVIINDILDYSRIEAGKLETFPAEYSFSELVKLCKASIEVQCGAKGLEFVTKVDDSIPENLYGDSVRIRQCVTNILTNAMKYTAEGGVYLSFINGGMSEDGSSIKLILSVRDTGQGISDEQMKNLFDRFQRLNESTNRAIEGTGLGLSLTKSLIDMMGGEIEVKSKVGVGSVFTITLEQKIVANAGGKSDATINNFDEISVEGMRVLVVDDSHTNLVLMKKTLAKFGVDADIVASGAETLDIIKDNVYDAIFLDHMMPEMDGVETFKKMKEIDHLNKETPVIMLTANAMSGAMEEYLELGFSSYLSKPCKPEKMKKELARYKK